MKPNEAAKRNMLKSYVAVQAMLKRQGWVISYIQINTHTHTEIGYSRVGQAVSRGQVQSVHLLLCGL